VDYREVRWLAVFTQCVGLLFASVGDLVTFSVISVFALTLYHFADEGMDDDK